MKNFFFSFFKTTFGIIFFTLAALVFFFSSCSYMCKKGFLISNVAMLGFIALLFVVAFVLYRLACKKSILQRLHSCIPIDKAVLFASLVLFLGQCYVFYNAYFETGWDVQVILYAVDTFMKNGNRNTITHYFSTYPNNISLFYFYCFLQKLNQAYGIFTEEYRYMCVVVVNCAINAVSCYLTYKTAKLFVSRTAALLAYVLAVFSVGLSGWSIICYSDSLALLCPILCVYLYCRPYKHQYTRWLGLIGCAAVSAAGYFIKPQCLFLFIAAVLAEGARSLRRFSFKKLLQPALLCLSAIMVFACVNVVIDAANRHYQIQPDENKAMGITHFLMMGANQRTNGVFAGEDVDFSKSIADPEQRSKANLEVFVQRIADMKGEVFTHLKKKMLTTFNDGTFAWGVEGRFFRHFPKPLNNKLTYAARSLYRGEKQPYLATVQHFVWLFILLFSLATVFCKKSHTHTWNLSYLWIVLLGFVFYEALFEVRARYIYIFVPILCVMACIGFKNMLHITERGILLLKKCVERMKRQ